MGYNENLKLFVSYMWTVKEALTAGFGSKVFTLESGVLVDDEEIIVLLEKMVEDRLLKKYGKVGVTLLFWRRMENHGEGRDVRA